MRPDLLFNDFIKSLSKTADNLCSLILCKDMTKRREKSRKNGRKNWIVHKLYPLLIVIRLLFEPINLLDFFQEIQKTRL